MINVLRSPAPLYSQYNENSRHRYCQHLSVVQPLISPAKKMTSTMRHILLIIPHNSCSCNKQYTIYACALPKLMKNQTIYIIYPTTTVQPNATSCTSNTKHFYYDTSDGHHFLSEYYSIEKRSS